KHPHQEFIQIDTTNILFICGGAFVGLDKIIESRVSQHPMGFGADVRGSADTKTDELFKQLIPDDLIRFGLIPEFTGRLPITVSLNALTKDDLRRILTEPKNAIIKQYKASLEIDKVKLNFEEDAIAAVADMAVKQNTGARGLRSIVEKLLLDIMFEIPSIEGNKEVTITRDIVEHFRKPEIKVINQKSA
ncbi:MAG: AAA family ATPase, partial [Spirochaetaceae bacterium]|nr:AAA family ATPase [Spirochaetaceae bacterium]